MQGALAIAIRIMQDFFTECQDTRCLPLLGARLVTFPDVTEGLRAASAVARQLLARRALR